MEQLKVYIEVKSNGILWNARVLYGEERKSIFEVKDEIQEAACYLLRKSLIQDIYQDGAILYQFSTGEYVDKINIATDDDVCVIGRDPVDNIEGILGFIDALTVGVKKSDVCADFTILYNDEEMTTDEFRNKYLLRELKY